MKYKDKKSDFQALEALSAQRGATAPQRAAAAPLGIATKLRTPPIQPTENTSFSGFELIDRMTGEILQQGKLSQVDSINEARIIRFNLQDAAKDILYSFHGSDVPINSKGYQVHHRTCTCSRFRTGSTTQIVKSKTTNKAFFAGLMSCANSRTCPICSAKISERKANEMRTAFNIGRAEKLSISLFTLTAPHHSGDKIDELVPKISLALQHFWRGATAQRFKSRFGIIGNIRSFEIRHGDNGWHPHFHIIIFSKNDLPMTNRDSKGRINKEQSQAWNDLLARWQKCCVRAGLSAPNKYGMDIQNGAHAGEYISKFGSDDEILKTKSGKSISWDMADEMTKGNTKTGRKGSSSPWDLLALSVDGETKEIKQANKLLFLFYARAMQGVNLIRWSRGLRNYFDLGAQATDEEILQQEEDKADLLCHIQPYEWEYIIKNKLRALVLQLAENGGADAIAQLLYVGNEYDSFDDFLLEFKDRNNLVDHTEYFQDDFETTNNLIGSDLSVSKVKPEYQNYLTFNPVLPRKISPFDRLATKEKAERKANITRFNVLSKVTCKF